MCPSETPQPLRTYAATVLSQACSCLCLPTSTVTTTITSTTLASSTKIVTKPVTRKVTTVDKAIVTSTSMDPTTTTTTSTATSYSNTTTVLTSTTSSVEATQTSDIYVVALPSVQSCHNYVQNVDFSSGSYFPWSVNVVGAASGPAIFNDCGDPNECQTAALFNISGPGSMTITQIMTGFYVGSSFIFQFQPSGYFIAEGNSAVTCSVSAPDGSEMATLDVDLTSSEDSDYGNFPVSQGPPFTMTNTTAYVSCTGQTDTELYIEISYFVLIPNCQH